MDQSKQRLLNETYQKFMDIGLNTVLSIDNLDQLVDKDVMGYGTTLDEKIFSFSGVRDLFLRQKEQSQGLQMEWDVTPVLRRVLRDENSAVYADDILLKITIADKSVEMRLRFSIVLEFAKDRWLVVHWHGSKPEEVKSEEDTFGIEDWKKKNTELEKKVAEKTAELQKSLDDLKATQAQLIQSEKMASLGELTAGIAHEIQNPLNFVNNFSEVNSELIAEMKEELVKGNVEEVKSLAADIDENEKKIIFHGKRADGIVKGMLQHSRSSNGVKEPTNINDLADEYLRLAYHGLRAKDKSFNATMKTDFDESIGNINIIPQDIGRVILNLLTNAFYAVREKSSDAQNSADNYEPVVSITTKNAGDKVEISVSDNGNGIPSKVLDKIFQPFFTTKPTGQGTGLGLSMSYDIITKGHGGELKANTKENKGTTFIIILPKQANT